MGTETFGIEWGRAGDHRTIVESVRKASVVRTFNERADSSLHEDNACGNGRRADECGRRQGHRGTTTRRDANTARDDEQSFFVGLNKQRAVQAFALGSRHAKMPEPRRCRVLLPAYTGD